MILLLYISGAVLVISIIFLIAAWISFRKATKPSITSLQSVSHRFQEENDKIKVQSDQLTNKKQTMKHDIEWKKAVFSFTTSEAKKTPKILFKTSANQKIEDYPREM
ncbi:hypothetical protein [Sutcliffiella halmapala]|uniref:hypothetical protein n=1 Tax=Sutcliffiella halmapala TaxID=79882 RepID=UPI000995C26D|nr:hypothetical protein [Sutcliffiella halmapala]